MAAARRRPTTPCHGGVSDEARDDSDVVGQGERNRRS